MAVKPTKRSNRYWARRAEEGLNKALRTSAAYERLVKRVYTEAGLNITRQVQSLYKNAYKKDKTFDAAKLNAIEPSGNIARFMATMKRYGLATALPDAYKGRLTRLQMLDAQIWAEVKKAGLKENDLQTDAYRKILNDAYKGGMRVIQQGTNINFAFGKMPKDTVNAILNAKFEGKNYSQRIWGETDVLANELQQKLATAVATGQSYAKTAREFRERFDVKQSYAERLIRTESCYFETEAKLQAYRDIGIEEVVFVATLDSRTSEVCQHADGERVKLSEAVVGDNIPPLHPNCRSTIRAYIGESFEPTERIARNYAGKNISVGNVNYAEYKSNILGGVTTDIVKATAAAAKPTQKAPATANPTVERYDKQAKMDKIEYIEVKGLKTPLTDEQIIAKLSGGDLTTGSCKSLAYAYAANKTGLDVTDYRGGKSRSLFSPKAVNDDIGGLKGVIMFKETNKDAFKAAAAVLKDAKAGKQYILSVGKHAAIIKRVPSGLKYLELQSPIQANNTWHDLNAAVLKKRFSCKHSLTRYGNRYDQSACLTDINSLKNNADFRHIMGYLNTNAGKQKKGVRGSAK